MNQSNLILRLCGQHKDSVMLICQYKDCIDNQKNRLIFSICINGNQHKSHLDALINNQQLEEKVLQMQQKYQKLINNIKRYKDNILLIFNNIEKEITKQYDYSIQTLNSLQNSEFNQFIQKMITFNDFEQNLNSIFIKPIQEFEEKINKFVNNLTFTQTINIQQNQRNLLANEFFEKGQQYFEQKNYQEALNQFDKALLIEKKHVESLTYKGRTLYWMDKVQDSILFFDKALKIEELNRFSVLMPSFKTIHKGFALGFLGNYKESLVLWESFNKGFQMRRGIAWQSLKILRILGHYIESMKSYDKALEVDKRCKEALCGKADLLRTTKKSQLSLQFYDQAIEVDKNYVQALWGKGEALRNLQQFKESFDYFSRALQIDQSYYCALESQGAVLFETRNFKKAETYLKKALIINQNSQFAKNMLSQIKDQLNSERK